MAYTLPAFPLDEKQRPMPFDRLVKDIAAAWPWPYSTDELKEIGDMLPADRREIGLAVIVMVARKSLVARKTREISKSDELATFRKAVTAARVAAEAVTPAALEILSQANSVERFGSSLSGEFWKLLESLYRFEQYDLSPGIPGRTAVGRPQGSERFVLEHLDALFRYPDGKLPSRSYQTFEDACMKPLGFFLPSPSARRKRRQAGKNTPRLR
jgi:hypothetical protein